MANRLEKAVQFVRDELGVECFRFDLLSQKLQWLEHIQVQQYGLPQWVNLTERDLNSLACRLAAYSGDTNISAAELRTVLLSDLVPAVNPLTEYLDLLPEWTPNDPDFIGQLAMQVKVVEATFVGGRATFICCYAAFRCAFGTFGKWRMHDR